MSTVDKITDAIYAVFVPLVGRENIYIEYDDNKRPISAEISSKTLPKCNFLELHFSARENNNIYVQALKNCKEKRMGEKLLNLVEDLATRIGSEEIALDDMSKLIIDSDKSVSLITLYNLTTGQSWYNKLGYICKDEEDIDFNHAEAFESNKVKITTTSVNNFVLEEVEPIVNKSMDKMLKEIQIQFPELDPDKTIQEYFIIVKDILQQYSDGKLDQDVSLLVKLVDLISRADIISTYNNKKDCVLVKEMKTSRGVGRIRKKHLSRKKRKAKGKSKGKNSQKRQKIKKK
jgi:hypothetical protein